jgi:hypothetical protein
MISLDNIAHHLCTEIIFTYLQAKKIQLEG